MFGPEKGKYMDRNREGYLVSDTERQCTNCGVIHPITSKMTLCKKCNSTRVKSLSPEWKMHQRAKIRAKERGHDFDLEVCDIVIPDTCPVLGIPLKQNSGRSGAYKDSYSLDRIDNSKGYTKDNIQVLSQLANAMKGAASVQELQQFADWVNRTYPRNN
jgi:hypothetical protein